MSHEPEPIVIDRRHPAWVAAFAAYLATCSLLGTDSEENADAQDRAMTFADCSTICIMQKDNADAKALSDWKAARRAERDNALRALATAMFNQNYGSLMPREKDVVQSTLAAHGDDLEKALASLADDFDPLADVPCPSVTP